MCKHLGKADSIISPDANTVERYFYLWSSSIDSGWSTGQNELDTPPLVHAVRV